METQIMKKLCLAGSLFMSLLTWAAPTISDLKVTPIEPLGLAIDYNVSGSETNDLDRPLEVTMRVGEMTYMGKALTGATDCRNGAHRVYWNVAKDGVVLGKTNIDVTVAYKHVAPLYYIIDLAGGSSATSYPVLYLDVEPSGGFNTTEYKTTKLVLKRVEAGSFIMGEDQKDESHRVTLTKPFYMGLFEVTQKQWELVIGTNPSYFKTDGDMKPVEQVSYNMIRGSAKGANWPASNEVDGEADGDTEDSFLGRLRKRTGIKFDLPTEAQWEYTCRARTTTTYSYGDSANGDYMWYESNSLYRVHEVGTKLPNNWGFYDMHGSVWEWCLDWYDYDDELSYGTDPKGLPSPGMAGSYRVQRGGDWGSGANLCTSSVRLLNNPSRCTSNWGFRLSGILP